MCGNIGYSHLFFSCFWERLGKIELAPSAFSLSLLFLKEISGCRENRVLVLFLLNIYCWYIFVRFYIISAKPLVGKTCFFSWTMNVLKNSRGKIACTAQLVESRDPFCIKTPWRNPIIPFNVPLGYMTGR